MVMLSAAGITEKSPPSEADAKPLDDIFGTFDGVPFDTDSATCVEAQQTPIRRGSPSLIEAIKQFADMQRMAYAQLSVALAFSMGVSCLDSPPKQAFRFTPELLDKSPENVLITDERLGIPGGTVVILEGNGVHSLAMLLQHLENGTLTKLPRIGKAKAAMIADIIRAYKDAVKRHGQQDE